MPVRKVRPCPTKLSVGEKNGDVSRKNELGKRRRKS